MRTLLLILLLLLLPGLAGAEERTLVIEYAYTPPELEAEQLKGFKLYQDNVEVCETDVIDIQEFECSFETAPGTYSYTMAATFEDGSLSPSSPSFMFTIDPPTDPTTPLEPIILRFIVEELTNR